jgi:hypothetical protein
LGRITSGSPDPYAPPASVESAASIVGGRGASARVAGSFLALNATVLACFSMRNISGRTLGLSMAPLVAAFGPSIVVLVVDWLLAVPLPRGSVRFRIVTWIRAALSIAFPVALAWSSYAVLKHNSPGLAEQS